jgi:hypothetical protein
MIPLVEFHCEVLPRMDRLRADTDWHGRCGMCLELNSHMRLGWTATATGVSTGSDQTGAVTIVTTGKVHALRNVVGE